MWVIKKILHLGNMLSLDVVLGAMAGMLFFADLLAIPFPVTVYFLLGIAVWSIYTLDHLWDAKSTTGKAHSQRHVFHQGNFRVIFLTWLAVVIIGLGIAVGIAELNFLLIPGFILGLAIVCWMTLLRIGRNTFSWLKEFSTAGFYVAGIILVPYLLRDKDLSITVFFVFVAEYFLVVWINLLILSYLDKDSDLKDGFGSILNLISAKHLHLLILFLAAIGIIILFLQFWFMSSYYHINTGLILIILLFHILTFLDPSQHRETVRQKLEASFLIPFVIILFP